jgi:putative oxidoreductase
MMTFLDRYSHLAHWFLRLAFASVFLFHGLQKVVVAGPYNMMVGKMGMPAPVFYLVTFAEVAAGAGVLLGGFTNSLITRLSGLAAAPVMIGAIVIVHAPNGWSFMNNGIEFPVVLLLMSLYFLLAGNPDEI